MKARPCLENRSLSWSSLDRPSELSLAREGVFDLIILGGGISGAGVAREAALRGLSFLLVDKEDFAFGTSSRSSKLVHGGFRYLSQGEFGLVRESTTERNWLVRALPNLVRPLAFHYCAYRGSRDTPGRVRLGVILYDLVSNVLSRFRNAGPHRFFKGAEMAAREPALRTEDLLLAGRYFDASVDDARLTLETLKEARDFSGGRSVVLNYAEARRILMEEGRVAGVEVADREGGELFTARSRCVVNATGIWTDGTLRLSGEASRLVRPTKGVHLVVDQGRIGNRETFALRSVDDGRTFFVMRRGSVSVIGTTDTDYAGDLDAPGCGGDDCDYLLRTVNLFFPSARLTREDVQSTYAGIRPLVRQEGRRESSVSRRHVLRDTGTGLVTLAGGKLTTFRLMAWDCLRTCARGGYLRPLAGPEARRHFSRWPYKAGIPWEPFLDRARAEGLEAVPEALLRHLHQQYGQGAFGILGEIRRCPALGLPFLEGHPFCPAEILHILAFENVLHLADVMMRRTEMQLLVPAARQEELAAPVARLLGARLGWDPARERMELDRYLDIIRRTLID